MKIIGVRVEPTSNSPMLLLQEIEGLHRVLSIFIGGPEATAIALVLEGVATPRPMTHDLLMSCFEEFSVELTSVEITGLEEGTFFANLCLRAPTGEHRIACRPSDGVALAVRCEAKIYVSIEVLDEVGILFEITENDNEENRDEVLEEFRAFLDDIRPEDFKGQ